MNRRNFLGMFVILPGAGRIWRHIRRPTDAECFMFGLPSDRSQAFGDLPTINIQDMFKLIYEIKRQREIEAASTEIEIQQMTGSETEELRQLFRRHLRL